MLSTLIILKTHIADLIVTMEPRLFRITLYLCDSYLDDPAYLALIFT
jgi:hypothetical protein